MVKPPISWFYSSLSVKKIKIKAFTGHGDWCQTNSLKYNVHYSEHTSIPWVSGGYNHHTPLLIRGGATWWPGGATATTGQGSAPLPAPPTSRSLRRGKIHLIKKKPPEQKRSKGSWNVCVIIFLSSHLSLSLRYKPHISNMLGHAPINSARHNVPAFWQRLMETSS